MWTQELNVPSEQFHEPYNSTLYTFLEINNKSVDPMISLTIVQQTFSYHQENILYKDSPNHFNI